MSLFKKPARQISEHVTRFPYAGAGEDSQGNVEETFGPGESLGVYVFDPGSSTEPREAGRDAVVTEPTLFLPPGSPFGPYDECEARGERFAVVGEPARWVHPTEGAKVDVVKLRRTGG